MKRTENTIRNIVTGVGGQVFAILAQFLCRTVFIKVLSAEYLGLNGLFSNILNILSLSEMGFGTAILYSLYKPIEQKDESKIVALLQLYKRIYRVVAIVVFVSGGILTPFIEYFIKEVPDISYLKLIYLLYLINTVLSYVCIYKRSILEADQKSYIINIYQKGISITQNIVQLIVLLITRNFLAYMLIWLTATLVTNLLISKKADERYPFIKTRKTYNLGKSEISEIKKNTYALFLHRIGGVVVNSTDNIIISTFVGLKQVGIYSNYTFITTNLSNLVGVIFNSATASVGNLGVTSSKDHLKEVFDRLFFGAYLIYGFCSVCLFTLFNPFIKLWVGNNYCLHEITVFFIVLNFYLNGTRILMRIFRDAFGLFWYFRYKSVFEALVNLVASFIMVQFWGINGVLLGTIMSTLSVAFWIEPYVLYKHFFGQMPFEYFIMYFIYVAQVIVIGSASYFVINFISNSFIGFIIKVIVVVLICVVGFGLFNIKNKNLKYLLNLIKSKVSWGR